MLIDYFDERKLTVLDLDQLSWELRDRPDAVLEGVWPVLRQHGISVQVRCRDDGAISDAPDKGQYICLYSGMDESLNPSLKEHQILTLGVAIAVDGKELINLSHDLTVDCFEFEYSLAHLRRILDHAIRVVSIKQIPFPW